MNAYIKPLKTLPFYTKFGVWIAKKVTGKDLLIPKILSWYPKAVISSGIMEALVAHGKKDLNERILKLVRMQTSLLVSCPFCIDMNFYEYEKYDIREEVIQVLQYGAPCRGISDLSTQEQLAIEYTRRMSQTPSDVSPEFFEELKQHFTEREIVILASTIAQVNYWARLNHGLGIPPAGFSDQCTLCKPPSDSPKHPQSN